jgi:hypothetical protein
MSRCIGSSRSSNSHSIRRAVKTAATDESRIGVRGHIYSYASTISFLQYLENKCDRRCGARDLIVGRQVKQTFPQLSPEQTCDMRPVQLDQIEGVEEHAGIMPALSDTTERREPHPCAVLAGDERSRRRSSVPA